MKRYVLVLMICVWVVAARSCNKCTQEGNVFCISNGECYARGEERKCSPYCESALVWKQSDCMVMVEEHPSEEDTMYMFYLSIAAYANNPKQCFDYFNIRSHTELLHMYAEECDFVADKCYGIIAVDHKHKDIVVGFRGTDTKLQLLYEILSSRLAMVPIDSKYPNALVSDYFFRAFHSLYVKMAKDLKAIFADYPAYGTRLTGHSLGGALASIMKVKLHMDFDKKATLFTFGQPRVGNFGYAKLVGRIPSPSIRTTHYIDPIAHLPFCNGYQSSCSPCSNKPYHHGTEYWFNSSTFPMPNTTTEPMCTHPPLGEDGNCSDGQVGRGFDCFKNLSACARYHMHYFGYWLGGFGGTNCTFTPLFNENEY